MFRLLPWCCTNESNLNTDSNTETSCCMGLFSYAENGITIEFLGNMSNNSFPRYMNFDTNILNHALLNA